MFQRTSKGPSFKKGEWVVFCMMKHRPHPGRRARNVHPSANGDDYTYHVEKYWVVIDVLADGQVLLQTRRGKRHIIDADDPNLRRATWLDRIRHPSRFAPIELAESAN